MATQCRPSVRPLCLSVDSVARADDLMVWSKETATSLTDFYMTTLWPPAQTLPRLHLNTCPQSSLEEGYRHCSFLLEYNKFNNAHSLSSTWGIMLRKIKTHSICGLVQPFGLYLINQLGEWSCNFVCTHSALVVDSLLRNIRWSIDIVVRQDIGKHP